MGRFELDIFIPSQKLAIEYDGITWHKEASFEREKRKYSLCIKSGVKLIRIKEKMPSNDIIGRQIADEILSVQDIEKKRNFGNLIRFVIDRLDPRSNMWTRKHLADFNSPVDIDLHRDRFKILHTAEEIKKSAAELYPYLVKEWHPTKNGEHKLTEFKAGSDFKVWWVCSKCGREYEATIAHRTGGTECKICGYKKLAITKRKKAAEQTGGIKDELLLREWDYNKNEDLLPSDFAPGSSKKVWWKCHKCEYEWSATIANRTQGKGCPCCANRVIVKGKNDLATLNPKLAQEWDYERNVGLSPDFVAPRHNAKVWWICSTCGHSYQASPNRRALQGSGCRKCADKMNWTIRRKNAARKEVIKGQLLFDL